MLMSVTRINWFALMGPRYSKSLHCIYMSVSVVCNTVWAWTSLNANCFYCFLAWWKTISNGCALKSKWGEKDTPWSLEINMKYSITFFLHSHLNVPPQLLERQIKWVSTKVHYTILNALKMPPYFAASGILLSVY